MASVISYLVALLTLVLGTVTGIRYRSSIRYTRYTYYYYYSGYRYTYYYYSGSYNTGIAGVVVGCVIAVGGVIACIISFCILCRRMRRTRTAGRLVTPAVYTANTTTVPGTVAVHGSTATLGAQPHIDLTYMYPPVNSGFPVAATNTPSSDGNTEQKHGAMPPPYEAVVGGVTSTVTSTSGTNADASSEPNTNTM